MSFWIVPEEETAFERRTQWNAYWNFTRKGEERPAEEDILVDEVPEGFTLRSVPPPKPSKSLPSDGAAAVPDTAPLPGSTGPQPEEALEPQDQAGQTLQTLLNAIGARPEETRAIVHSFGLIDELRNDPQYLHNWLATHIANKVIHAHIPLVVNKVMSTRLPEPQTPYYLPVPGAPPQYYGSPVQPAAPGYPYAPQPTTAGYYGPPPQPVTGLYAPPATAVSPENKELMDGLATVSANLAATQRQMEEDRATRAREKEEEQRAAERAAQEARMTKLEELIANVAQGNAKATGQAESSVLEQNLKGIQETVAEMKQDAMATHFTGLERSLQGMVDGISSLQMELRTHPGEHGKTMEDLLSQLGPLGLAKLEAAGERLMGEAAALRATMTGRPLPEPRVREVTGPTKSIEQTTVEAESEYGALRAIAKAEPSAAEEPPPAPDPPEAPEAPAGEGAPAAEGSPDGQEEQELEPAGVAI